MLLHSNVNFHNIAVEIIFGFVELFVYILLKYKTITTNPSESMIM